MNGAEGKQPEWWEQLALGLQGPAKVHGEELFSLVHNAGVANFAGGLVHQALGRNQEAVQALGILMNILGNMTGALVKEKGWTAEKLAEVQRDIEMGMQLAGPGAGGLVGVDGKPLGH